MCNFMLVLVDYDITVMILMEITISIIVILFICIIYVSTKGASTDNTQDNNSFVFKSYFDG